MLSFTLIFSFTGNLVNANDTDSQTKKAMIVVPGLLASGLFYRGDDCTKYYKNESIWIPMDLNYKQRVLKGIIKLGLFSGDICCDENGQVLNKDIGALKENVKFPYEADSNIAKYAVDGSCKKLIDTLSAKYPDQDVFMYSYDWRRDMEKASEDLAQIIRKYDQVVLIGHSLGGIVSCKAAMKLKETGDLNKISKFISVAVPYNGATPAFYVLNSGIDTRYDPTARKILIKLLGIDRLSKNIAKNYEIVFQLLPSKVYFERASRGYLNKDGKNLNYNETLEFIKNCAFSKKHDGTVKWFANEPQLLLDSLVDKDGKHILNYLDYHLIVGQGADTMAEFDCNLNNKIIKYVDGDGTVALNESAIPFENISKDKIFKVNFKHQEALSDDKVIENIMDMIFNSNKN